MGVRTPEEPMIAVLIIRVWIPEVPTTGASMIGGCMPERSTIGVWTTGASTTT
jgi:hypothetical protein